MAVHELHRSATDPALLGALRAGPGRIGLTGLLEARGSRARPARPPGSAVVDGFRWRFRDSRSLVWWPQGVAVGSFEGGPLAMATWFAQVSRGRARGSRLTVVDLRDARRPRYHHVLLVTPTAKGFEPVRIHAGGLAWTGDRLFVAATFGGIREFRLSDILRVLPSNRSAAPFGYRHVLPEFARYTPPESPGQRMRYSFLSLEIEQDDGDLRLLAGEYGKDSNLRLARLRLGDKGSTVSESHVPGIPEMQGAVLHDGRWFVSASRGDKRGGDLWTGTPDAMVRHEGVLPPGPEDLAVWPERRQLWGLTEYPGKRWMFAVDLDEVG